MKHYDRLKLGQLKTGESKSIPFSLLGQSTIKDAVYAFNKHNPERKIKTKPLYDKNMRVGTIAIRVL